MLNNEKIWIGNEAEGERIYLSPKMANRHGLIAGATGTGKTVTLKVMAESFSDMGVPVFLSDVKGDIAGMCLPGSESDDMRSRIERFGLAEEGFDFKSYPVNLWDVFGKSGMQLRTTISEMGPVLLSRILKLNDLQSDVLSIVFKIADDEGLLLIDTKDLKSMINYIQENSKAFAADYGNISSSTTGAIMRAIVSLELDGGDIFFGEPALKITDFISTDYRGKGMVNILCSESLVNNGTLYSMFLLWLLSELFETLPEVGNPEKPKLVFFFDEAHLLFDNASKDLMDKIEQMVKLIRSKGVGVYFVTQNPRDIPDGVISQLGNKIEHALHAYTPAEQKSVKAAADSFRANPGFDTYETITSLGTGEALVSFLGEDGVPEMVRKVNILPPQSSFGSIDSATRDQIIKSSLLYSKYAESFDPDSAYEFLARRGLEKLAEEEKRKQEAEEEKIRRKEEAEEEKERKRQEAAEEKARLREEAEAEKERKRQLAAEEKARQREEAQRLKEIERAEKEAERKRAADERAKKQAVKSVGSTVAGTVGREVGKSVGSGFGGFGKTLGGNVGASLGRGLLSTLFKL